MHLLLIYICTYAVKQIIYLLKYFRLCVEICMYALKLNLWLIIILKFQIKRIAQLTVSH